MNVRMWLVYAYNKQKSHQCKLAVLQDETDGSQTRNRSIIEARILPASAYSFGDLMKLQPTRRSNTQTNFNKELYQVHLTDLLIINSTRILPTLSSHHQLACMKMSLSKIIPMWNVAKHRAFRTTVTKFYIRVVPCTCRRLESGPPGLWMPLKFEWPTTPLLLPKCPRIRHY